MKINNILRKEERNSKTLLLRKRKGRYELNVDIKSMRKLKAKLLCIV